LRIRTCDPLFALGSADWARLNLDVSTPTLSADLIRDARRRVIERANRQVFADDTTFNPERAKRLEALIDEGMRQLEVNLVGAALGGVSFA
jgi:hypothetical protein